jgi:hypothetical protein
MLQPGLYRTTRSARRSGDTFRLLQSDPTADDMRAEAVTDDFRTGMPSGGYQWDGPRGREDFLCVRKGFVDEQHDIDEVLSREDVGEVVWLKTLLTFHLRDPNTEGLSPASRTRQAHHRCFVELARIAMVRLSRVSAR